MSDERDEDRYFGFAYRSTNDFESERLPYGLGIKPPIPEPVVQNFPEDFIAIMKAQREQEARKPVDGRVFVGGEAIGVIMENGVTTIHTIHRFEDYDEQYEQMCEQLPIK